MLRFLFRLAWLAAAASLAWAAANDDCLTCHGDKGLKNAAGDSVFVDPATFAASVHGRAGLACTDCHTNLKNVKDFPHATNLSPVPCAACHSGAGRGFQWGKIRRASKKAENHGNGFQRGKIHGISKKAENNWIVSVKIFYRAVIAGLISVFLIFIAADLFSRTRIRWKR